MIYIQFTSPKSKWNFFSHAIRLFERSKFSHVRIQIPLAESQSVIFEASGSQVKFIGQYGMEHHKVNLHHEYAVEYPPAHALVACMKYAGVKYGLLQVFGIAIARILGLKKNPLGDGRRTLVCSELVMLLLSDITGYSVYQIADVDMIGPAELKQLLDRRPDKFNKII